MKARKNITIIILFTLSIMLLITIPVFAQTSDITGHWAAAQVNNWLEKGLIRGYEDGTFKPDNNITRAEFVAVINRALGLTTKTAITFSDVSPDAWYAGDIEKAKAAGYILGYEDGAFKPDNPITRIESAKILTSVLKLNNYETSAKLNEYQDAGNIPQWGKESLNSAVTEKYFQGYPDNTIRPLNNISRAEAVTVLYQALGIVYNVAGIYGPEKDPAAIKGNVAVTSTDVIIRNTKIEGNLILTAGVGDGNVQLDNVSVTGRTLINGGGAHSVIIRNSNLNELLIDKDFGEVPRIIAEGTSVVGNVTVESPAKLEENNLLGKGFDVVQVSSTFTGNSALQFAGDFKVNVNAKADIELVSGNVTLETSAQSAGTTINVRKEATIVNFIAGASALVKGEGKVEKAEVNAAGVTIQQQVTELLLGQGITVSIAGKILDKPTVLTASVTPTPSEETHSIFESIAITIPATKLIYSVGDNLDITGLQVTGTYRDARPSAILQITEANVTGFNSSEPAVDQVLTITAGGETTTYNITVLPVPDSIAITVPANKLFYSVGDNLDITGLQVTGTYSDTNTTVVLPITEANITGFNSSETAYDQVLTITVGGKTATYTVSIEELVGLPGDITTVQNIHYGDYITMQSAHWRNYISGRSGRNKTNVELIRNIGQWEVWQILKNDDRDYRGEVKYNDTVLLKSKYWGNYISSRDYTVNVQVMSDPGPWERFTIIDPDNTGSTAMVKPGAVALFKSVDFGKCLSASGRDDYSHVELIGNTDMWERWLVAPEGYGRPSCSSSEIHFGDIISLKSGNFYNYLSGRSGKDKRDVKLMSDLGEWEDWEIVDPLHLGTGGTVKYNDTVAFCSLYWNNYLSARDPWGQGAAVQAMKQLGPWERWKIVNPEDPTSTAPVKATDEIFIKSDWGSYLSARGSGDEADVKHLNKTDAWERWYLFKKEFYRNWMSSTPELKTKTLRRITFPATHDTGTWDFKNEFAPVDLTFNKYDPGDKLRSDAINSVYAFEQARFDTIVENCNFTIHIPIVNKSYTIGVDSSIKDPMVNFLFDEIKDLSKCQDYNITQQLNAGIRWFDLRVYLKPGGACTHHFLVGVSMDEVLDSIANFCATTNGEVVVVEMSHFEGDDWSSFAQAVKTKLGNYAFKPESGNPFDKSYEQVVGENPSSKVILLMDKDDMSSDDKIYFWTYAELGMKSQNGSKFKYSETTDKDTMINKQVGHYTDAKAADSPFTLWYTLTTNGGDILKIIPTRLVEELPVILTDELLKYVPGWVLDTAKTVGFDVKGKIREMTTNVIQSYITNDVIDYRSTKDLSNRVNPDMGSVLKSQFQDTSGSNYIQVIYADFFEYSKLVDTAIEYSRDCNY
ncbi:MAG: S-layer homology domain-containing protein [Syntrophomonas sp.]